MHKNYPGFIDLLCAELVWRNINIDGLVQDYSISIANAL